MVMRNSPDIVGSTKRASGLGDREWRMLLDRHYHMAWLTRTLVVLLLIGILTSGLWLNWLDKVFDLVLAGMLFLALFCETRRYKAWREQANPQAGTMP